jgi:N-acyl-D-amino-acid deacylase
MVKRLGNFEFREKIRDFVMNQREKHSMPTISMVADGLSDKLWIVTSQKNPELIGKSLKEISELRDTDPLAAAMDLMIEEGGESMHIVAEFHFEDDMRKVIRHPLSMIMSDEYSWAPYGPLGKEARVHPRCYGTFPLTIRKYVRGETRKEEPREVGEKIITLMEAIRKMTSFPAQKLGLWDRGLIREGMCADIVVFDSQIIEDQATYANPHQYPKGLPYVIVNGRLVVENGEHTSELPGKILRGPGYLARS